MAGDDDESEKVREYIRELVPDWEEPVKATARFKLFSGQSSDWAPQYRFWRELIMNIARRFNFIFISPSHILHSWFSVDAGLTPLCLPHVLVEMYKAGDVLRTTDLEDPTSTGRLSQLFNRLRFNFKSPPNIHDILNHTLVLPLLLKEKADDVVKALSETHWTPSCILTMTKFQSLFRNPTEASAVLSYMSVNSKAKYLSLKNKQGLIIQGVKLSLSSAPVSAISSLDYDILQLVSTVDDFQHQIQVIDNHYQRSRHSALAALRSCDKTIALRHARQLKLASARRAKIVSFFDKVEAVLYAVFDAQTTTKVSQALQIGARAIKQNRIDVKQVHLCLQEVDELMNTQDEISNALGTYDDDDLNAEEELQELESQIRDEDNLSVSPPDLAENSVKGSEKDSVSQELLSSAMTNLKLKDDTEELSVQDAASPSPRNLVSLES